MAKRTKKQAAVKKTETQEPTAPVQPIRPAVPAMRHLVIETNGDVLFVRANTMGLIELKTALQMLALQVDSAINQAANPSPPVPAPGTQAPELKLAEESKNE